MSKAELEVLADPQMQFEADALAPVIDALDEAISRLPDGSEWKWACLGIRRHMATDVGLPVVKLAAVE